MRSGVLCEAAGPCKSLSNATILSRFSVPRMCSHYDAGTACGLRWVGNIGYRCCVGPGLGGDDERYDTLCHNGEFARTTTARMGSWEKAVDVELRYDEDVVAATLTLTHGC